MLYIHSAPRALAPHIEWAVNGVLGATCRCRWQDQSAEPGLVRTETRWSGGEDTGAQLATALRGWDHLRYEIVQEPSGSHLGARWTHTPDLGIFYAPTDEAGNTLVPENRLTAAIEECAGDPLALRVRIGAAIGEPWDEELEVYRHAGEGTPRRRLHAVG